MYMHVPIAIRSLQYACYYIRTYAYTYNYKVIATYVAMYVKIQTVRITTYIAISISSSYRLYSTTPYDYC